MNEEKIAVFWFRRDLRLKDNAALYHALRSGLKVLPIFIFDPLILDPLENRSDTRVTFIYDALKEINNELKKYNSSIKIYTDAPLQSFKKIIAEYIINAVFTNTDYERYAIERDDQISQLLKEHDINFKFYKDHVIFDKNEVMKDDGTPYTVFTPYSKKWKSVLNDFHLKVYPTEKYFFNFLPIAVSQFISLDDIGFSRSEQSIPPNEINAERITNYAKERDYPSSGGTSLLGIHLRFGTLSIREAARAASQYSQTFLNELIWRDFYQMILWNFPRVGKGLAFKPAYDNIPWRFDESEFIKWCNGETGYAIVDAGMRQLNETGFMHNRIRMVVASFLCKHLLHDWRLGEAYFAEKLLDYDFASNNGGWQWASGSGCDSAPYFRIFNPYLQTKKFDPELKYVRKWVPEFEDFSYPQPIVNHEFARERCLRVYKEALNNN